VDRIRHGQPELTELLKALSITTNDLEEYLEDERNYLDEINQEVTRDDTMISAEYVELLEKLSRAK
jgi:hypothetical protein